MTPEFYQNNEKILLEIIRLKELGVDKFSGEYLYSEEIELLEAELKGRNEMKKELLEFIEKENRSVFLYLTEDLKL